MSASSGYPRDHGFGHEEWNNSDQLKFRRKGVDYRAFHTERVGNAPVEAERGHIFVFMYASHDRVQELVGIAGNASCLVENSSKREALASQLKVDVLSEDAWNIPRVRQCYEDDRNRFDKDWRQDSDWIPNWVCPVDFFMWLDQPAAINPKSLRGTDKLLTMYGSHTELSSDEAAKMMDFVPRTQRTPVWNRIRAEIGAPESSEVTADINEIVERAIGKTTKRRLIDARLGQGMFRSDLDRLWDERCAVSGCNVRGILRASHVKCWRDSNDRERLDPANGLLLTADLDALFDRGLISFHDDGEMQISHQLSKSDRELFRLPRSLRKPVSTAQTPYLAAHRDRWGF